MCIRDSCRLTLRISSVPDVLPESACVRVRCRPVLCRDVYKRQRQAQYSPFGIAPVVAVTYEGILAERLQDTDQCCCSVDAVKLFRQTGDSVSYTHLDVYKRQVLLALLLLTQTTISAQTGSMGKDVPVDSVSVATSDSLQDVYKRQVSS